MFAIILPNTAKAGAFELAETIGETLRALKLAHEGNPLAIMTVSIGCASLTPQFGLTLNLLSSLRIKLYTRQSEAAAIKCAPDTRNPAHLKSKNPSPSATPTSARPAEYAQFNPAIQAPFKTQLWSTVPAPANAKLGPREFVQLVAAQLTSPGRPRRLSGRSPGLPGFHRAGRFEPNLIREKDGRQLQ